jgi:ADP-ribose pyrophosphatase YjhB (NUDIX family)
MTTDRSWMFDSFIGDSISIKLIKQGIIKFNGGKEFNETMDVLPNTKGTVWSCNVEWNGNQYGVYLTDNIMPQYANDVLFVWKNQTGNKYIKLLTRGNNENVDMPLRMMPGAGEHMEPGTDIKVKAGILRAVNEEIGIDPSTLTLCYLLNLGIYNSEGRDPRYWEYSTLIDGKLINFGMKRGSTTNGYILYLVSESNDYPKEIAPQDTQEVGFKWWSKLDTVLSDYPNEKWMILNHQKFIPDTISKLNDFDTCTNKDKYLFNF